MAQTYTLDEAAGRLSISADEMKKRLKDDWKHLRSFRDGPTLRFRAADIDELARSLGATSDHDFPVAGLDLPPPGSDEFLVPGTPPPPKSSRRISRPAAKSDSEAPLSLSADDIFILAGDSPSKKPGDSSIKKPTDSSIKKPADSSVRLGKKPDSDLRLKTDKPKGLKSDDDKVIPTEEIALDFSGPGSAVIKGGSSAKLSAPKSSTKLSGDSGKGAKNLAGTTGDSSEFELSLDADSDDFELKLDGSDEVDIGDTGAGKPKSAKQRAGESGIFLRDPADSGVNLEKRGKKKPADPEADSDDFELSLEPDGGGLGSGKLTGDSSSKAKKPDSSKSKKPGSSKIKKPPSSKKNKIPTTSGSDSEFELTLDDATGDASSLEYQALAGEDEKKGDIFETDFEIPSMSDESGSEAVAVDGSDTDLENNSDFDIALNDSDVVVEDESGSQVVVLEDEAEATPTPRTSKTPRQPVVEVDDGSDIQLEDDDGSAASALTGVKPTRVRDDDEDEDEEGEGRELVSAAPAAWGVVPVLFLFPALLVVSLGGIMSYELLHTMWGYNQPKRTTAPLVRGIAGALDMDVKDQ